MALIEPEPHLRLAFNEGAVVHHVHSKILSEADHEIMQIVNLFTNLDAINAIEVSTRYNGYRGKSKV